MKRSTVILPSYVIGEDAYQTAAEMLKKYGSKAVIVGGKRAMAAAAELLTAELTEVDISVTGKVWFGGKATYENVDRLQHFPEILSADMILAMGGGHCSDTCKVLAERLNKPLFTFPTIASNCAPCSALSIMYSPSGGFLENYYPKTPPICTFINTKVIADAPLEYLQAGIGDALSKAPEVLLSIRHIPLDQNLLVGKSLCAACMDPLLDYGVSAIKACRRHKVTSALEEVVLDIIITTGLVSNMTVCPEFYYNTNLAHCFYYGATVLPASSKHAHGYLVAYGTQVLLDYDGQFRLRDRVMSFCQKIGLPTCLADMNLTPDDLPTLVEKASSVPGWNIEGFDISVEHYMKSILRVDQIGAEMNLPDSKDAND